MQSKQTVHPPYLLCGKVERRALTVVRLVDRSSGLQQNLCAVKAVCQHAVHQRGPAKLVLMVPQRWISYRRHAHKHRQKHTHTRTCQNNDGLRKRASVESI